MSKTQSTQCCVWDFTSYDTNLTPDQIRTEISKHCKKYSFQLEKGEKNGKNHWQGRVSFKQKLRKNQVVDHFKRFMKAFHVSVTSDANRDNNFYVEKEETRIQGPFTDQNYKYIPRDVRNMKTLRPWQETIREELAQYNERQVDVIVNTGGNVGKTRFTRYMECYEDAETIDFVNDYKDLMRMAYDLGPKKIYMIDMPRAISKEKLFQFYGAVETLKSGKSFDDRYGYKKRLFDPPRIIIFCNELPNTKLLTKDMWKLWDINENMELIEYGETETEWQFEDSDFTG